MKYNYLLQDEIKKIIDGAGHADRVPCLVHDWIHIAQKPEISAVLSQYPFDAQIVELRLPERFQAPDDDPNYRWVQKDDPYPENFPHDAKIAIDDWSELDEVMAHFPDPGYSGLFPDDIQSDGRYQIGHWWYLLFERHWHLRGMENALTDYYLYPDEVHRLFRALTEFYKTIIVRARKERKLDAIWTSDDLGTQTGTFFSPETFDEFYLPYYKEIIDCAHENGMHFWLHSCGNITALVPKLIDLHFDVLHPIQRYAMNDEEVVRNFGGQICFWAGFDVQRIIPWGTPDDVRKETRRMIDLYARRDGRFMFTMGNGVNEDCPAELLEALLDELFTYGTKKMSEL